MKRPFCTDKYLIIEMKWHQEGRDTIIVNATPKSIENTVALNELLPIEENFITNMEYRATERRFY